MAQSDPRWITAKFPGKCSKCGEAIHKGNSIFYYPIGKRVYVNECAEKASRDFHSMVADESMG